MKRNIFILILFVILLSACDTKKEYIVEKSKVVDLAGEWYVAYYINGTQVTAISTLLSYNTAADDGLELWVDDGGNFWDFKVKAHVVNSNTFGSEDELQNESYDSKVILNNGKIFSKVSEQPSGAITDSIYFEVQFDDDGYVVDDTVWVSTPYATVFQCAGVRRTGFLEDEH